MKKFLLTLIVTMLTCIGAWAQDDIPTQDVGTLSLYPETYGAYYSDFYTKIDWDDNGAGGNTSLSNAQSSDEECVTVSIDQGWQLYITPKKKTASPVKVSVDVTKTYNDGSTPAKTIRAEYSVTVLGYTCILTISPDPGTGISLEKGQNSTDRYKVTADWKKGDTSLGAGAITVESANSDIASIVDYYSWENSFFIKGVADGETSITVKSAYSGQVETKTFTVNVFDPTIATSIDAASEITMVCESQKQFSVNLLPNTATNFTSITCDIPGVTCEKVGDNIVNGVINFNIDASTISEEKTGKITITAGTVTKEINLIIKAPVTLTSMSISPSEEQIIKVGDNFTITITPDPEDATYNLDKTFSDVISCVEGTNSITVTGQKPGRTELVLTPDNKSELAKSIWVTVTQPITDASITLEGVPTSTRVGVTGAKAVVKVNDAVAGSDFGITYASTDETVLTVNPTTGEITPVAAGTAKVRATLNPNASTTYYTGSTTIESAEIAVGAEITGNWTGTLEDQTLDLAEVKDINSFLTATWTGSETGAQTYYYIESANEDIVKASYKGSFSGDVFTPSGIQLIAYATGSTTIRVKAVYGVPTWVEGPGWVINSPLAVKYSDHINVTVNGVSGSITLDPSEDITMDLSDDDKYVTVTASWPSGNNIGWEQKSESSTPSVATAELNGNQITIHPVGVGVTTVTVTSKWTKHVYNPENFEASQEITKTFNVTVTDKTLVTTLTAPADQTIQRGVPTEIPVSFAPSTAVFQNPTSDYDKVTVAYKVVDEKTNYGVLVVTAAADAELEHVANITLTPKATSTAAPVTFQVTVAKPKLPVSDVRPKSIFYVGEEYETELVMGGGLTLNNDYTQEYAASNNVAKNDASKAAISLDPATGKIVALNVGTAHIQSTFTPVNSAAAEYDIWSNGMDIAVLPGKYSLDIDVANHNIEKSDETATTTLTTPVIKLNGVVKDYDASKYDIEYSVDPAYDGVSIEGNTVSITSAAAVGVVTIKAVLTPKGDDVANYEGATAYTQINIEPNAADKHGIVVTVEDGVLKIKSDYAGAYGTLETPTIDLTSCSGITSTGGELTNDDVINAIKAADKIEIEGLIKNTDMQIFSSWVGGPESKLVDLNMGEAYLTEKVATNEDGNDYVANISFIQSNFRTSNHDQLKKVEKLVLPHPAAGQTVLPAQFAGKWLGDAHPLNDLTVSEGWTEIGERAFDYKPIENLSLPNSLIYIRRSAFFGHHMRQLFLPPNVDVIEYYAFANDPSTFEDVFFSGRTAPTIVDTDAFSSATQIANNSVAKGQATAEGTITRNAYKQGTNYTCMMHYPSGLTKEELATYVDPTRVYNAVPRAEMDGDKSGNGCQYAPWGSNWDVVKNLKKGSYVVQASSDGKVEAAYLDPVFGTTLTWPSQQQMESTYAIAGSGYHWDGTPFNAEEMSRQGIYQFVLARGDASPDNHDYIFERDYSANLWWSICVPFNMSVDDIENVFGVGTKVVRFSKVVREAGEAGVLRLEFTNSVMGETGAYGSTGNFDGTTGILAHRPYMIRPSAVPVEGTYAQYAEIDGVKQLRRVFPGYDWITGALIAEDVVAVDKNGTSTGITYTFKGNHSETNGQGDPVLMPQYSYFLSALKGHEDDHQFFFQMGEKGRFHAHTAVVITDNGAQDAEDFFTSTSNAPVFKSIFGDVEDDATGIEKVELVFGNETFKENVKVYTINGQLVNGSNLAPGLYIKNGKKFIVK